MTWNLWLPFWIGISMLVAAIPLIFILPPSKSVIRNRLESEPLLRRASDRTKPPSESSGERHTNWAIGIRSKIWYQAVGRPNFKLLVAVFLAASLASCNTPILPQYISKRYGWTFAEAGYLLTVKAAVNIVLLTSVVPTTINALLKRQGLDGVTVNLHGAKACLAVSVLGAILVATSFKIWMLISCKLFIYYPLLN